MKTKVTKFSEIITSGTLCLNVKRYIEECYNCDTFKTHIKYLQRKKDIDFLSAMKEALKTLNCKPRIDNKKIEKIEKIYKLKSKISSLNKEIKKLKEELNIL